MLHRKYVSLIYNGFQNRTTEDLTEESDLFSNYRIDMEIDDPVTKMSSWDLVLFREEENLDTVDMIFIEVKTSVKSLNLEEEIRNKIGKTISTLVKNRDGKLRIKMGDQEKIISCIEFVVASPPDCQGELRNKFQATNKYCPIILWQIDDSSAVQSEQFVGKLSIQYASEQGVKVYPLCCSRQAKSGIVNDCYLLNNNEEWYSMEKPKGAKLDNLKKHNHEKLNSFLESPNINSLALIPGRSTMIDNLVNDVVLITNGPLSGKGEMVSKTKNEWKSVIDEFFNEYGLVNYDDKTTYGEYYSEQLIGANILIQSKLTPNSFYVKKTSGKPEKILSFIMNKVFSYEKKNRTQTFRDK
ncbi:MAG: hypothetical protein ACYCWK_09330 [Cuniculiplasma sp.]